MKGVPTICLAQMATVLTLNVLLPKSQGWGQGGQLQIRCDAPP